MASSSQCTVRVHCSIIRFAYAVAQESVRRTLEKERRVEPELGVMLERLQRLFERVHHCAHAEPQLYYSILI